ncbi:DEKNAAC102467 [Brettanomyces naardenensis]|uniref:Fumarate reductase n=1 Tax=Brettanomyces naardenensis TaxID=13370 RepID=A0A448YKT3_BRENA|nr:DEKNAAC102467 [Brettanomyces naardenensis]
MSSHAASKQVIVVGSGLAGLSAAHAVLQLGQKVTLLEMMPKYGGNSIKASSGINGAPTRFQPLPDDLFYQDTVKSSGVIYQQSDANRKAEREALMKTLVDNSQSAIYWLTDRFGVDLAAVAQLGGHSRPRTHRGTGKLPPGFAIVSQLWKDLETKYSQQATLRTHCRVTRLLTDSKGVVGVEFEDLESDSKLETLYGPVVFAVGGFAGDTTGLITKYRPDLVNFPSTNTARPQSIGLLEDIGGQLMDMESIQVHPSGFVSPEEPLSRDKFLAAELLRGEGGILLDSKGKRFVNEMLRRDQVTDAIFKYCDEEKNDDIRQWKVWLVLDEGSTNKIGSNIGFYQFKKLLAKKKISDFADEIPNIKESIKKYAQEVSDKKDTDFGRTAFGGWTLKPEEVTDDTEIIAGRITPVLHFTMGGVKINPEAQFLNTENQPIKGIWGAGEITSGVHSSNRLGGSSLLECVVFGRIAGSHAASSLKSHF